MRNFCNTILNASDATSQTSAAIDTNQTVSASYHFIFGDSTAAGTVKVQASNDPTAAGYNFTPTNWIDIPSATATVTAGAPQLITIAVMTYRWIRVVFTSSVAGSTTVKCDMNSLSV